MSEYYPVRHGSYEQRSRDTVGSFFDKLQKKSEFLSNQLSKGNQRESFDFVAVSYVVLIEKRGSDGDGTGLDAGDVQCALGTFQRAKNHEI